MAESKFFVVRAGIGRETGKPSYCFENGDFSLRYPKGEVVIYRVELPKGWKPTLDETIKLYESGSRLAPPKPKEARDGGV